MKKRFLIFLLALVVALCVGLTACDNGNAGGNGGNTHTSHDWSTTYTNDGDRHYQTCSGCTEKKYSDHNYGTGGVCVCGKTQSSAHTSHNWSKTYTNGGDQHYQTCDGCDEKQYSNHDYGTSGVCICGKQQPTDYVAVTSVTLNKTSLTLDIGNSETLTATVLPENATYKSVHWSSDKPEIADVDENGTLTAYSDGTTIITATADGKSDTCTVTVNPPAGTNAYAEIVTAIKALMESKGETNVEVLTIFQDEYGYLAFAEKNDNGYGSYSTDVEIGATIESAKTVDISAIASTRLYPQTTFGKGLYNSDGTADEKQMVSNMIAKLLGDGYTVMYGAITVASDKIVDATLGNVAGYTINALIEKNGSVFEYREMLTVTKDLGDVYQTVLDSTEANKENRYRSDSKELTDLGEVAKLYLAELTK